MKRRFTPTFLVTPARHCVGLTSVALGIVRALQPQVVLQRELANDLSRGALVDDIVFTIALTAIQAQSSAR